MYTATPFNVVKFKFKLHNVHFHSGAHLHLSLPPPTTQAIPQAPFRSRTQYFPFILSIFYYIIHHFVHLYANYLQNYPSPNREICSYKLCMLDIPGALAEDLGDLLLAEGATSISVEEYRPDNAPEEKIFANDPSSEGLKRVWERCSVVSYFPPDFNNADAVVVAAAAALGLSTSDFCRTLEEVRAQDWEAAIKESYQPVRVADGLWIVPTWCDAAKLQDNSWSKEKNGMSGITIFIDNNTINRDF